MSTSSPPSHARAAVTARACTRPLRPRSTSTCRRENRTLATITFQNYFRLYGKLSGMTGTGARPEAEEFQTIYELDIVEIPTNKPVVPQGLARTSSIRTRRGRGTAQ